VELTLARRSRPADLSAYHLLLEARLLMFRMTRAAFAEADRLLDQARARDPGSATVLAERAAWHGLRIGQGWAADRKAETRALEQVLADALELDASQPRALAMRGHNHSILRHRLDDALPLFDRALAAAPNDAETLIWTVPTFAYLGEGREAVARAERAIALSPEDPLMFRYQHFRSIGYYALDAFDAAAHWGLEAERANPNYTSNLRTTAASLAAIGQLAEARRLMLRAQEVEPEFRVWPGVAHVPYSNAARRQMYGEQLLLAGFPA
jgi:tetratricopeptide (TPR) repeat protein